MNEMKDKYEEGIKNGCNQTKKEIMKELLNLYEKIKNSLEEE